MKTHLIVIKRNRWGESHETKNLETIKNESIKYIKYKYMYIHSCSFHCMSARMTLTLYTIDRKDNGSENCDNTLEKEWLLLYCTSKSESATIFTSIKFKFHFYIQYTPLVLGKWMKMNAHYQNRFGFFRLCYVFCFNASKLLTFDIKISIF